MSRNAKESLAVVERVVRARPTVEEGLRRLAAYCHVKQPNPVWQEMLQLDTRSDVAALRGWLERVLRSEPPAQAINALWFGLYNPVLRNGRETSALYVSGSTRFNIADRTSDWAAWEPESYMPVARYISSDVLAGIFTLAKGADAREWGECVMCLGYASLALQDIITSMDHALLLGARPDRAVAVGFDEGDFLVLQMPEKTVHSD